MKNKIFQMLMILMLVAIVVCFVIWIIMAIGALKITDGCLYRYSFNDDGTMASHDTVTDTVILKANGNYTMSDTRDSDEHLTLTYDPNAFGQWLNTHFIVKDGQKIVLQIRGEVSLCKSYVPRNNPMSADDTNIHGQRVAIPRVEDEGAGGSLEAPLSYILDARENDWKTIAEVFPKDKLVVSLSPDRKDEDAATHYNFMTDSVITADCTDGKRDYNPICGRYTLWSTGDYVSTCSWDPQCYECNCRLVCDSLNLFGWCIGVWNSVCDWCGCYQPVMSNQPEPYRADGYFTSPWKADPNGYLVNFWPDCRNNHSYVMGAYQGQRYFWMSADNGAGFLYRFDPNEIPANPTARGSNYVQGSIISGEGVYPEGAPYHLVINEEYGGNSIQYLQVKLNDSDDYNFDNLGGYVVNIKHTKCRRFNGNTEQDTYEGRGLVEYVILPPGTNPNDASSSTPNGAATSLNIRNFVADLNGNASITVSGGETGNIWMRIKNDPADMVDSTGQYEVQFAGEVEKAGFIRDVLNPLFEGLKDRIKAATRTIFKNMTCYGGIGDGGAECTNFFNYLRGILALYIMIYGMMFLIGSVQISQMDLVTRVVKVGLVAGLMNENTYDFFNNYVFDFVTSFSDEIIANIGGYSTITDSNSTITNPLIFLDNVMTKIFHSTTFKAQVMALVAMGTNGFLYFIIVFITIIIVIIASLRAIAIYIMAYVAIAVLIGMSPLFLSFILFSFTRGLFENWIRFTFRYMIEPVIVLAGLIILVQLFTIYLDIIIGYSVCWKCAIAITIPFADTGSSGFSPAFLNVPLFCINWFAPWGHDVNTGPMGLNFGHIAALLMLAYCMYGYIDFAGKLVSRIAGASGAPSATRMGSGMASTIGDKAMSSVGLDRQTRAQMSQEMKRRVGEMITGEAAGGATEFAKGSERLDRDKPSGSAKGDDSDGSGQSEGARKWKSVAPTKSQQQSGADKPAGPIVGGHRAQAATSGAKPSGPVVGGHRARAVTSDAKASGPVVGGRRAQAVTSGGKPSGLISGGNRAQAATSSAKSAGAIMGSHGAVSDSKAGDKGNDGSAVAQGNNVKSGNGAKGSTAERTDTTKMDVGQRSGESLSENMQKDNTHKNNAQKDNSHQESTTSAMAQTKQTAEKQEDLVRSELGKEKQQQEKQQQESSKKEKKDTKQATGQQTGGNLTEQQQARQSGAQTGQSGNSSFGSKKEGGGIGVASEKLQNMSTEDKQKLQEKFQERKFGVPPKKDK